MKIINNIKKCIEYTKCIYTGVKIYSCMLKHVNITIEAEHYDWCKRNNINISSFVRCIIDDRMKVI